MPLEAPVTMANLAAMLRSCGLAAIPGFSTILVYFVLLVVTVL